MLLFCLTGRHIFLLLFSSIQGFPRLETLTGVAMKGSSIATDWGKLESLGLKLMKNKTGYYSCNCNNQQQQKICCSCLHYYWPSLYWSKRIMQPRPNKYETAAGDEPDDQGRRRVPRDVAHHPRSCQHQRRAVPPHRLLLGCHQEQHLQHRGRHHWPYVVLSLAITCLIAKKKL